MKALNTHPSLVSGKSEHGGREIHFFSSKKSKHSLSQYHLRFPLWEDCEHSTHLYTFDKSPDYMRSKQALAQLSELLPSIKLIVILRDPVRRAVSEFYHNCRHGRYVANGTVNSPQTSLTSSISSSSQSQIRSKRTVIMRSDVSQTASPRAFKSLKSPKECTAAAMRAYFFFYPLTPNRYTHTFSSPAPTEFSQSELSHGYYAQQLEWLYNKFERRQLLVLFHEDMAANLSRTLTQVERFLKIKPFFGEGGYVQGGGSRKSRVVDADMAEVHRLLNLHYRPHNARLLSLLKSALQGTNDTFPQWLY